MDNENKAHPFEKTLGAGPYKFVGFFEINIEAGKQGRPYINPHLVHARFVTGAGTCAHCGMAILNVFQVQVGNGDVYGVGSDCIAKAGLPYAELTKVQKAKKEHEKKLRAARKARKGDQARATLDSLISEHGDVMAKLPHPSEYMANQGKTLKDYAAWIVSNSNDGGVVIALKRIEHLISK